MNQVPHTGSTNVRSHRAEFRGPGHVAGCIRAPLVPALRVVQVRDVIFHAPSMQPPEHEQVCGKFIAFQ